MAPRFGGGVKCPRCDKFVYAAEEVKGAGKSWHRLCFNCKQCGSGLTQVTVTPQGNEIFCKNCHLQLFGPSGYRGGGGAALQNPSFQAAAAGKQMCKCGEDVAGKKFCPGCGSKVQPPEAGQEAAQEEPVFCANCGVKQTGGKFCPECGTPQAPKPKVCSCGVEVEGLKFCGGCGKKVE